ncbi:hypothetical protein [Legionella waltersii]|uniref:Acetate kinase n=1 Tax=Legionella waltersii TaxID=66969 RepID=A0A0W1ADB2_9GAMM|nr:hypothetical protein [Legionella waltersii]KTD79322.1 acetate kinase [Legionella waltersii]SNV13055.1 acetate kinase [Legionella waltersii]
MRNKIKSSILVINTGSSSVKFQVFSRMPSLEHLAHGKVSDLGSSPLFSAVNERQEFAVNQAEKIELPADYDHEMALHFILHWIEAQNQHWQINTVSALENHKEKHR